MTPIPSPVSEPRIEFTKPAAAGTTPAGISERTPTTSFDVDLYEPRPGDSYESISREYYSDTRYARALAEFNRRKPLHGSGPLDVPPIHILKQRYAPLIAAPTGATRLPAEWVPASATTTTPVANVVSGGSRTFVVPPGGMSIRAVSRLTLGTENRWREIYDLNPQFAPDSLPAGAQIKLPANAVMPR